MAKSQKKPAAINTPPVSEVTQETQVDSTEETKTPLEPVQLTIADLGLLSRIVDLASRRGAFQAGELKQVGEAYDKLAGFLAYVESVQEKEEAEKVETDEAAEPVAE